MMLQITLSIQIRIWSHHKVQFFVVSQKGLSRGFRWYNVHPFFFFFFLLFLLSLLCSSLFWKSCPDIAIPYTTDQCEHLSNRMITSVFALGSPENAVPNQEAGFSLDTSRLHTTFVLFDECAESKFSARPWSLPIHADNIEQRIVDC